MYNSVETPISQSKGAYWIARAHKELGHKDKFYEWMTKAAKNSHVFYGQMAIYSLNKPIEIKIHKVANDPALPSKNDKAVMDGIRALAKIDPQSKRLRRMLFDLSKYSENAIAEAVVDLCVEIGKPEWAVIVAKIAGRRDPPLVKAAYPIKELPSRVKKWDNVDVALIHSLIRQESGFNTRAKSHVGARGLMQIMPRTARLLSRKLRLKYSIRKLTADPNYNMILGCYYVSQLMKEFKGSKVKTLAGYNAGESRVRKWVKLFGEPDKDIDIIDWMESIPFSETRSYVMRVMESYPVYQHLLKK
jgi:soluble lytic murein transglycosylase